MTEEKQSTQIQVWNDEALANEAKEIARSVRPLVGTISFRGGVMKWQDIAVPNSMLDCVVIAFIQERNWFPDAWDPDNIVPPSCFAMSSVGPCVSPHPASVDVQSELCEGCEWDKWGSAGEGRRGKACKEIVKIAIMPVAALKDAESIKASEIAIARVSVTNVRAWSDYVTRVDTMFRRPPWAVVTKITCEPDKKTQIKLGFQYQASVDIALSGALKERNIASTALLLEPYQPREEEEPQVQTVAGKKAKHDV